MKQAIANHVHQMEKELESEMEKNLKHNAAQMNKKAKESEIGPPKKAETEDQKGLGHEDSRPALETLQPNTHTAVFDDRTEYLHNDGSKLIDKGNSMSVEGGKWSTPASQAALVVDAAVAKGWESIQFHGNDEFKEYGEALAKARGLITENKLEQIQDQKSDLDNDFGNHPEQDLKSENEPQDFHFEPLADQASTQQQEVEHTQPQQQEELEP